MGGGGGAPWGAAAPPARGAHDDGDDGGPLATGALRPPPPAAPCGDPQPLPPAARGGGYGRRYAAGPAAAAPQPRGRGLCGGPGPRLDASCSGGASGSASASGSLDDGMPSSGSTPLECIIIAGGGGPPAERMRSIYDVRPPRARWHLLAIAALTCMLLPFSNTLYVPCGCRVRARHAGARPCARRLPPRASRRLGQVRAPARQPRTHSPEPAAPAPPHAATPPRTLAPRPHSA
jgi:hypothetical protein